jgi:E3 ubiquitin-protein ligase SHPRH
VRLKKVRRYFRQLQELSDTVAEAEWEGSIEIAIQRNEGDTVDLEVKIKTGRARQRYLEHLAKSQEEGTLDEEEEACILCKCEFERGYITQWYVLNLDPKSDSEAVIW